MPFSDALADYRRGDRRFPDPPLTADALPGQTVVVTGASDGIGRALAWQCAGAGARVVVVGRNRAKTQHVVDSINSATGRRDARLEVADLSRLDEMHALAARLVARDEPVHAFVANAGALYLDRGETADGIERTFALNHLGAAVPVLGVEPVLSSFDAGDARIPARVLFVSSRAHRRAPLAPLARRDTASPDASASTTPGAADVDWQSRRGYTSWGAYGTSKLANVLFARALAARLDPTRVVVHALHPGLVASRFATNNGWRGRLVGRLIHWFGVPPAAGSDTAAWLLGAPAARRVSGRYWVRRRETAPSRAARDDAGLGADLWRTTVRLAQVDERAFAPHGNAGAAT